MLADKQEAVANVAPAVPVEQQTVSACWVTYQLR